MSEIDSPWSEMAARVVRVVLARKGVGYAEVSERLAKLGVEESDKSLAVRLSRGRISLVLLLQVIDVSKAQFPLSWQGVRAHTGTWEERAIFVIERELARHPLIGVDELARRIIALGAGLTQKTLENRIASGTLSLATFLQCLVALGSESLAAFIDYSDLVDAANQSQVMALATAP